MKKVCKNCNETFSSEDIFCPNCGKKLVPLESPDTNIPQPPTDVPPNITRQFKKNKPTEEPTTQRDIPSNEGNPNITISVTKPRRKTLPIVLGVVALVVAVAVLLVVYSTSRGNYYSAYGKTFIQLCTEDYSPVVFLNGKYYNDMTIDSEYPNIDYNSDETAIGVLDDNKTLWLINDNGKFKVDDDVSTFRISLDGNCVVYTTSEVSDRLNYKKSKNYIDYSTGYLKRYYATTNTSEIIDNDVLVSCSDVLVSAKELLTLSENGNSLCYVKSIYYNDDGVLCWKNYVYSNSISSNFAKSSYVLAINDDATMCYWNDTDKESYYYGNILTNSTTKLCKYSAYEYGSNDVRLTFNRDCSECLASIDGKTYIVVGEQDKEAIGSFTVIALFNNGNEYESIYGYDQDLRDLDTFNGCILEVTDTKDNDYGYYYISKSKDSWTYSEISNKSNYSVVSKSGKYVYGIKRSSSSVLHKTSVTDPSDETEIALHVTQFKVSKNGRYVYYIDDDSTLYSYDGKESTRVDIDVDNLYEYDNTFYYIKGAENGYGTLYCSYNGKAGQKVDYGNDVFYKMEVCDSGILFVSGYDTSNFSGAGTLYMVNKRSGAVKLQEDILTNSGG